MKVEQELRHPIVSGIFYPEEAKELRSLVRDLVRQAQNEEHRTGMPETPDLQELRILLVPHAAYQHIGSYLARAFASIPDPTSITRAVLISAVHRDLEAAAILPEFSAFDTPLGSVKVDTQAVSRLADSGSPYRLDNIPHTEEHAQEVLLPMLQECCPQAAILPLLLGSYSKSMLDAAARQLRRTGFTTDPNTLWLLSSNLSSFTDSRNSQKEAEHFIAEIEHPSGKLLASRSSRACGRSGLYLLRQLFSENINFVKLKIGRSGIIQPEQREVWYGSFAGYVPAAANSQFKKEES